MKLPEVARRRSVETEMVGERIRQTMLGINSSSTAKSINSILMTVCQGRLPLQAKEPRECNKEIIHLWQVHKAAVHIPVQQSIHTKTFVAGQAAARHWKAARKLNAGATRRKITVLHFLGDAEKAATAGDLRKVYAVVWTCQFSHVCSMKEILAQEG